MSSVAQHMASSTNWQMTRTSDHPGGEQAPMPAMGRLGGPHHELPAHAHAFRFVRRASQYPQLSDLHVTRSETRPRMTRLP